jgi:D-alanyl-D-alanine carboxypeptidase
MQRFARWAAILVIVTVGIASGVTGSLAADEPAFAAKLRPLIQAKMKEWVTPGIIVYVDIPGRGTWIEGFGVSDIATKAPMSTNHHHRIGSVTKTLTAKAILLLVDEGEIGLDDPVSKYLPRVPDGDKITIRQMLDMTSGIYNGTEDRSFNEALDARPERIWTPQEFIELSLKHPPYFAPGADFHYSNTNYELLGLIVEKVSGLRLADFMEERIFRPLGMTGTMLPDRNTMAMPEPHGRGYLFGTNVDGMEAYDALLARHLAGAIVPWPAGKPPVDATNFSVSYAWASGSAISTIRDMAIWAKALAAGALLKPETHDQQITWSPHAHYGLGITESLGSFLGHNGAIPGYQTLVAYDPQTGATIVVFANNQLEPNIPFTVPADTIAALIYKELFP